MKEKFSKKLLKIGTGVLVFAGTLVGTYSLVPNKSRIIDLTPKQDNGGDDDGGLLPTHFQQFVNKLTTDVGVGDEEPEVYNGLLAEFDNFALSFTTENSTFVNNIEIDGNIEFLMRGLKDINFNIALDVDYNGKNVPLEIGYNNSTVFFGLKDLRLKCSSTTYDEILDTIAQCFIASEEEGGLNLDVGRFLDDKIDGLIDFDNLDLGALMSSMGGETAPSFSIEESQNEINNDWDFTITVVLKDKNEETGEITENPFCIVVTTTEDYLLKRVDLGTISIGNFTISGAMNMEVVPNLEVLSPENELSSAYNANYTYTEIVAYKGWIRRLADLLAEDNQKFGLEFLLDLDNHETTKDEDDNDVVNDYDVAKVSGSVNVDFSDLIDWSATGYLRTEEDEDEIGHNRLIKRNGETEEESLLDKVLNKVSLGIELNFIGKDEVNYGNLAISYVDGEGYLNLNESIDSNDNKKSVLKAKVETETFNWMLNELPGMISSLSGEEKSSSADSLFSFITDSDFVSGIKEGNYSVVLDMLSNISNDDEMIYLDLDLSSLGLGNNANVNLTLDSRVEEGLDNKVINLTANNIAFGDYELNAAINSSDYHQVVVDNTESYDSISFLPSVFDQVSGILDSKQAGFAIEGSVLDDAGVGIELEGKGQFDYGTKFGFGDLTLKQYKYNHNSVWYTHKIALDVDNQLDDFKENNVRMIYGDTSTSKNIKASLTVQSILDIINTVKTFIKEDTSDNRFSKFIEPLMSSLSAGAISDAIANKDYLRFLKNDLLQEVGLYDNGNALKVVVGGDILGLASDIELNIKFKNNSENKKIIDSLVLNNLVIGEEGEEKYINFEVTLKDYDPTRQTPCNHSWTYMDLNSVATLLDLGINTTKLGYYQLTADVNVKVLSILPFDVSNITVHVVVDGKRVKIYGILPDIKLTTFGSFQANIETRTTNAKAEFTFQTYADNDPHKTNDIGGYFDIKKTITTGWTSLTRHTDILHYRSTSKNFLDHIMTYLLVDLLDVKSNLVSSIENISLNRTEEEPAATDFTNLFTSTGFKYDEGKNEWNVGLNLNEVTGIKELQELEATITGTTVNGKGYLTELYANLTVATVVSIIATINLVNPNPSVTDWSSNIQTSFNNIVNVSFSNSVLDDPNTYLKK